MQKKYNTESWGILCKIKELKDRKDEIEAKLKGYSQAYIFRELSIINYKISIQESHLNGTFGKNQRE